MIQEIRIKNFKSLKDVAVDMTAVNLFVGPNNSGKSNFLRALAFFGDFLNDRWPSEAALERCVYNQQKIKTGRQQYNAIEFSFHFKRDSHFFVYQVEIYGVREYVELYGLSKKEIPRELNIHNLQELQEHLEDFDLSFKGVPDLMMSQNDMEFKRFIDYIIRNDRAVLKKNYGSIVLHPEQSLRFEAGDPLGQLQGMIWEIFHNPIVYKVNPVTFDSEAVLENVTQLNGDCSNLVPYLFYLQHNHKDVFKKIEEGLWRFTQDFREIALPLEQTEGGATIKIKLYNQHNLGFWVEEVSEGELFLLALLTITHMPEPPRLLQLEEPERGLHPRRVVELLELVKSTVENKGVQVIMTTHSPYLIELLTDETETVFVFNKKDSASEVNSLKRIMEANGGGQISENSDVMVMLGGLYGVR